MTKWIGALIVLWYIQVWGQQGKSANQLLELAETSAKQKDWTLAKDYINQFLLQKPLDASGYIFRGDVNEKLERNKDVLTDYNIALSLDSTNSDWFLKRGIVAFNLDRFDIARKDFKKLLRSQSTETNMVYFRQSNDESVDKIFTLQTGVNDMLYNYLGLIETKEKHFDIARLYFDSALRINPKSADYFTHRGLVFLSEEKQQEAASDFEKALGIDPYHSVAMNNLAIIHKKEGKLEEAERYLNEAKSNSQRTPDYYGNLALLQFETGRLKDALLNFDTAISLNAKDGELFLNRGMVKEKLLDSKGALQDYSTALRIDSGWPKIWFVQGNYFVKQNDWEKAIENFTVAISLDHQYALAYYNRSISYFNIKNLEKACIDLQTAVRLGVSAEPKMLSKFCIK